MVLCSKHKLMSYHVISQRFCKYKLQPSAFLSVHNLPQAVFIKEIGKNSYYQMYDKTQNIYTLYSHRSRLCILGYLSNIQHVRKLKVSTNLLPLQIAELIVCSYPQPSFMIYDLLFRYYSGWGEKLVFANYPEILEVTAVCDPVLKAKY